jgi:cytochrome c oxidase assembly protein subunit 11
MKTPTSSSQRRNHIMVATACGVFVAAMVGAAYAAVPLYNWFCRTTGFGGTTQVATAAPSHILDRKLKIRFDANVAGGLPWRFEAEQSSIEVKIGEVVTVSYSVVNESARETVGVASTMSRLRLRASISQRSTVFASPISGSRVVRSAT